MTGEDVVLAGQSNQIGDSGHGDGADGLVEHSGGRILVGDVRAMLRTLSDESVHCVVTSPPFWGLRDYGVVGQLGMEPVLDCLGWATKQPCDECYICNMVGVFRDVRRVMRKDALFFLNIGDSYNSKRSRGSYGDQSKHGYTEHGSGRPLANGLKLKDLCMVPARLALALQADGYYLRSDVIWSKPNPMPESVTDRPVKSHEYVYILSRSARYYYDPIAIAEPAVDPDRQRWDRIGGANGHTVRHSEGGMMSASVTRSKRTVWTIPTEPVPFAHFACFPQKLVEPCILAGTSEKGVCRQCGAPWRRVVERQQITPVDEYVGKSASQDPNFSTRRMDLNKRAARVAIGDLGADNPFPPKLTTGWQPTCTHDGDPVPATVLDCFGGSGATARVAERLGRRWILVELNPNYVEIAKRRTAQQGLFQYAAGGTPRPAPPAPSSMEAADEHEPRI